MIYFSYIFTGLIIFCWQQDVIRLRWYLVSLEMNLIHEICLTSLYLLGFLLNVNVWGIHSGS
jgi:hypothetical protein